jgi:hypothetical protein
MRINRTRDTFRGIHEPLIPTKTFETVQAVLDGKQVDRTENHVFLYSRLVRCGSCGFSLIAERQKGHVYYRCHNRPFKNPRVCPPTSIREEEIDLAIAEALMDVDLTDEEYDAGQEFIRERREKWDKERHEAAQALKLQNEQIKDRLSKLADVLLDGTLERSLYETKQKSLLMEQTMVTARMRELESGSDSFLKEFEETVELAKSPSLLYKTASLEKKRELLKTLLSNLTVSSKNVAITLSLPFRLIRERERNSDCRANRGTCRTWEQIMSEISNSSLNT